MSPIGSFLLLTINLLLAIRCCALISGCEWLVTHSRVMRIRLSAYCVISQGRWIISQGGMEYLRAGLTWGINKDIFAPPGCKIIAHKKPGKLRPWAPHGQHGYSLGPAMHHYRCQNVYISATASERIVDTLKFFPHNFRMPQLSSTDRLIMAANDMSNSLKNPHPEVPFYHIGDDTITALTTLAKIFKNKFQKVHIPGLPTAPAKVAKRTFPAKPTNPILAPPMPPAAPNEITNNNYRSRHNQRAITSEGGHANDESALKSEGANALTKSFPPKLVPIGLYRHGHCPNGHRPGKSPLVRAAPSQYRRSPHHWKRNGINGPCERPSPATTLETRIWQRIRTPLPRHSRHPWNWHMFLYQTYKHPNGQTDHLRQNSLWLQTPQKRKRSREVDSGRRHARLLRLRRDFHGRHHTIQNPNQQHPFHRICSYDDDGHKKLLLGHSFTMIWIHENVAVMIPRRDS
jgi:hypothetical protein